MKFRLRTALAASLVGVTPALFWLVGRKTMWMNHQPERAFFQYSNRLIHEKSPYLLQHAHNPVDWYPWGDEAFQKARKENKPIFLSIGYSTCHWCHVMENESYNDPQVARLMNNAFVSIKVDREERPDIDSFYMKASFIMTGTGGWPLNIIMTPDGKPFFAGTYFPKESRFGQIGMLELVPKIQHLWKIRHEDLVKSANHIITTLGKSAAEKGKANLTRATLKKAFEELAEQYDERHGGFGAAPKFPTPSRLFFLLRYWKRTGDSRALAMVERTLQAMRQGGIYDHVGLGFHRYSTDSEWIVPHFEKMLYDQALLAMAYTEAFQATGKTEYAETAREILNYVLRDMRAPTGGFYSAQDADSEGEEGKFYRWTDAEIEHVLGKTEATFFHKLFDVDHGILHLKKSWPALAAELKTPLPDLSTRWEKARWKLFAAREKRVHPGKDDKILADWNGLMIAALAQGGEVLHEPRYAKAAAKAARFILTKMRLPDGRLLHRYRDGEAALSAYLDDYAFLEWGLLNLYEATFNLEDLQMAMELNSEMRKRFWDDHTGGFYFAVSDGHGLLARQKEIEDGAVPSGNSVAMLNLLRLARMTANPALEQKAVQLERAFARVVNQYPAEYPQLMCAVDFATGPSYEVVIVGNPKAGDTQDMLRALTEKFLPNMVVLLRPAGKPTPDIVRVAEFTRYQSSLGGKATAYVCVNYACKQPTTEIQRMLQLLNARNER